MIKILKGSPFSLNFSVEDKPLKDGDTIQYALVDTSPSANMTIQEILIVGSASSFVVSFSSRETRLEPSVKHAPFQYFVEVKINEVPVYKEKLYIEEMHI